MPFNYICTNAGTAGDDDDPACPVYDQVVRYNSERMTRCPQCWHETLQLVPEEPQEPDEPQEHMEVVADSNLMARLRNDHAGIVDQLIDKFAVQSVSRAEASRTKDYIVTVDNNTNRIDRQGPVKNAGQVVTHARFAVQIGGNTYAGIHMPVDADAFSVAHVRAAFRRSLEAGRYVRLSWR